MRFKQLHLLAAVIGCLGTPLAAAAAPPAMTGADVGAWLDGFLPFALERGDVAGAVVVVVRDGETLVQRGYGYADRAAERPVDPETTLFRIGSVSKLFTWTAVMQLVESGRLDLDRDVNEYLDFTIPPHEGGPVTMRHLMTHTPGFEEVIRNLLTDDAARLRPLDEYLKDWTPTRIFPAGEVPAYSNYGVALAGYIVERVSGTPLDDYLDEHLFGPLEMTTATTRQPLPDELRPHLSNGYDTGSGPARPFEIVTLAPAGSGSATGADMAKFMIAWLRDGRTGAGQILRPETVQRVLDTRLALVPPLNGMLLGFMEENRKGRRIVGHGGDSLYFHSSFDLFPGEGVGLFFSMNSSGKNHAAYDIRTALLDRFADRYFPVPDAETAVDDATAAAHARQMAGVYKASRRAQSSFLSLAYFLSQVKVSITEEGELLVPALTAFNGEPMRWIEVRPFVWQQVGGSERLAARVEDGSVTTFSVDAAAPFSVFQRVQWWESSALLNPLISAALLILVLTVLAWPVTAIIDRRSAAPARVAGQDAKIRRYLHLGVLGILAACVGWVAVISLLSGNLFAFNDELDAWLILLRVWTLVALFGGTACAFRNARRAWLGRRSLASRGWSIALCLACLTMVYVAFLFGLVDVSLDY